MVARTSGSRKYERERQRDYPNTRGIILVPPALEIVVNSPSKADGRRYCSVLFWAFLNAGVHRAQTSAVRLPVALQTHRTFFVSESAAFPIGLSESPPVQNQPPEKAVVVR